MTCDQSILRGPRERGHLRMTVMVVALPHFCPMRYRALHLLSAWGPDLRGPFCHIPVTKAP
jgi:hypothetical protein